MDHTGQVCAKREGMKSIYFQPLLKETASRHVIYKVLETAIQYSLPHGNLKYERL